MITFTIPLRTVSGMNAREHWRARMRRVRAEHTTTVYYAGLALVKVKMPCVVTLTRVSSGTLDTDNLASALKGVRDAVAKLIGVDDGDVSRVQYRYAQEKGKRGSYSVRVDVHEGARLTETIERHMV